MHSACTLDRLGGYSLSGVCRHPIPMLDTLAVEIEPEHGDGTVLTSDPSFINKPSEIGLR